MITLGLILKSLIIVLWPYTKVALKHQQRSQSGNNAGNSSANAVQVEPMRAAPPGIAGRLAAPILANLPQPQQQRAKAA